MRKMVRQVVHAKRLRPIAVGRNGADATSFDVKRAGLELEAFQCGNRVKLLQTWKFKITSDLAIVTSESVFVTH